MEVRLSDLQPSTFNLQSAQRALRTTATEREARHAEEEKETRGRLRDSSAIPTRVSIGGRTRVITEKIKQALKCYRDIAQAERMKCGRPGEMTTKNAVRGAKVVCEAAGIPLGASVERLTRKSIDDALVKFLDQGIARVSAWSYVCQLRAVFAKWTRSYYEDRGWEIPKLELPSFRAQPPRYVRPTPDLLRNVKLWYKKLEKEAFESGRDGCPQPSVIEDATATTLKDDCGAAGVCALPDDETITVDLDLQPRPRVTRAYLKDHEKERAWLAATLMLEFAMRNGDVLRLTPDNFIVQPVKAEKRSRAAQGTPHSAPSTLHFLSYTPHKTELSSGRRVCWPIHPAIWERLGPLVTDGDQPGSALLRTLDSGVFERINREMRLLGFYGGKGAYELRKICIDHIYQKFGAEKATAISGDDIKTVTRYYADPSAVTVVGVCILDLM